MVDKLIWFLSYCDFLSQKSYKNKLSFYLVHICAQDTDCHVNYHLQQDFGKPQQHVEIRKTLPHHSGEEINC